MCTWVTREVAESFKTGEGWGAQNTANDFHILSELRFEVQDSRFALIYQRMIVVHPQYDGNPIS